MVCGGRQRGYGKRLRRLGSPPVAIAVLRSFAPNGHHHPAPVPKVQEVPIGAIPRGKAHRSIVFLTSYMEKRRPAHWAAAAGMANWRVGHHVNLISGQSARTAAPIRSCSTLGLHIRGWRHAFWRGGLLPRPRGLGIFPRKGSKAVQRDLERGPALHQPARRQAMAVKSP